MSDAAVFAVVLAAGQARRYGSTKQLAHWQGEALVTRAVRAAEAVCGERTLLVTGHDGAAVYAATVPLLGFRLHNSEFSSGLASSVDSAVAALAECADGILLMLADQALIEHGHLRRLIDRWRDNRTQIVASAYAGTTGVPAVFPPNCFADLCSLSGDRGARDLLRQGKHRLLHVACEAAAVDIDCPADLDAQK